LWNVVIVGGAAESIIFLEVVSIPDMGVVPSVVNSFWYSINTRAVSEDSREKSAIVQIGLGVERKFECL
jgi:G:T-mismatch repair DNA endonuclease (very short patch repair protein)